MNHREKQILCGLFLSKFDRAGLEYLGFEAFTEAFNAIGYGIEARPASIKNYRDEIDPYFPNERKGWHKRPLRDHCRRVLDAYKALGIEEMGEMVKSFLLPEQEIERIPQVKKVMSLHDASVGSSFAKRLITGRAAEQYFAANSHTMPEFEGWTATDTTAWGCGFDFKLTNGGGGFRAIEVKGIRARSGQIQMTELEHSMAEALVEDYYLVVVRNFIEAPFHSVFQNPLQSTLTLSRTERQEVRVSWNANVTE